MMDSVYLLGRKGDVINMGGLKDCSYGNRRSCYVTHEKIKDCACIPIKDEITGEAPKLVVVTLNEGYRIGSERNCQISYAK